MKKAQLSPGAILERIREGRKHWETAYRSFAWKRGFRTFNDWPYHRRGFIECWAEPGFHRFWQIWNPGIAYFVYRLYCLIGGRKRWVLPTMGAFTLCGLAHTLVVVPFGHRWSFSLIITFSCFGLLTILSRRLAFFLRQERWPIAANVLVNAGLVLLSFGTGFRIDRWISCAAGPAG